MLLSLRSMNQIVKMSMCQYQQKNRNEDEYESDSEDEYVSTPSYANQQVKTPRETVKNQCTHSQKPKANKKELGYGFTARACFVCGSLNHLIRDCDFHEKRMARQAELNKGLNRNSGQREIRPIWNNVQRVNKQNQFVPTSVLTRTGKILVNTARASGTKNVSTARHNFNRQAVLTSTAMKVNTVKPIGNRVRPENVFHKTHSPSSRPFKKSTLLRINFSKQKVNTAKANAVSTVGGKRETDYLHRALKNKGIVDSRCSRYMTRNKAYLAEFQDFNGGPVAFGGSNGYIAGKGGLACLIAKATIDESNKWHRRLGHVNFKNLNKLVMGNLVRCLPSKIFQNDHTCVACQKGKQHKAFCKAKSNSRTRMLLNSVDQKGSRGNIVMPELHNKMELLKERIGPLLRLLGPCLQIHFYLTFWAEVVSTACYVVNRVLVTKPHNKIPYELLTSKIPIISYIRPFGCHVTILNTIDHLGKFTGKSDEGFLVGSENQANNHAGQQEASHNAGTKDIIDARDSEKEDEYTQDCFVLPIWSSYSSTITPKLKTDEKRECPKEDEQVFLDELEKHKRQEKDANEEAEALRKEFAQATESLIIQAGAAKASSSNIFSTVSTPAKASSTNLVSIVSMADFTNLEFVVNVSHIPTSRINSSHPSALILGDPNSAVQTRNESWVDAMQEELLQFKIQKVWILVDLPYGKKAIGTKWVYRNKKDERGVVVRNKASAFLYGKINEEVYVSQPPGFLDPKYPQKVYKVVKALYGLHQAPRAWINMFAEILKSLTRRGTIDKTLFIKKDKHDIILVQVYVDDIIFGSTKKSWCDEFEALMKSRFQMSSMGELTFFLGLQVKQKANGIFISQDKYVVGKPKLGLWYPRVSSFDLESYSDSDYAGANLDKKSTTRGCQFLGRRLISWQCKKQTIVATSTTEA
ncbi:putative ribonuclease H-like domain-containing protein [Tanacetum coccineum]